MNGTPSSTLSAPFGDAQQWLFEGAVQPADVPCLGLGNLLEDGYRATGWLLVGLLQIAVMLTVFGALERWRPVEPVTDRAAVRVDVIYTLIHRLGLFRVALFFTLDPLWDTAGRPVARGRAAGLVARPGLARRHRPGAGQLRALPGAVRRVNYALHRAQHRFDWWWQLHALHHSQRQMTMWSDNRNHLLDDLLRDSAFRGRGLLVGMAPAQFVAVVAWDQLMESLSHANVRLSFGPVLGAARRPAYHRLHHAHRPGARIGRRRQPGRGQLGGAVPGVGPALRHRALRRPLRAHGHPRPAGRAGTTAVASGPSNGWVWHACWDVPDEGLHGCLTPSGAPPAPACTRV
jgi:sterol desaturase/sphingolipid hydroxylase (fatty acid hydroxylase superfamily)